MLGVRVDLDGEALLDHGDLDLLILPARRRGTSRPARLCPFVGSAATRGQASGGVVSKDHRRLCWKPGERE